MRCLCLHGTGTNASVLEAQLAPLKKQLEKDGQLVEFHCINGKTETQGFPGLETSFEGPFFRYYHERASNLKDLAPWILTRNHLDTEPESWVRRLRNNGLATVDPTAALASIQDYTDQQSKPFDLVLGFSEGASVAASMIVHQAKTGCGNAFQGAIFICGSPPYDTESHQSLLADEVAARIGIPTAHIVGSKDPGRPANLALYNLCERKNSSFFDHGKSHSIPWDNKSTSGMAAAIREVRDRILVAQAQGRAENAETDL